MEYRLHVHCDPSGAVLSADFETTRNPTINLDQRMFTAVIITVPDFEDPMIPGQEAAQKLLKFASVIALGLTDRQRESCRRSGVNTDLPFKDLFKLVWLPKETVWEIAKFTGAVMVSDLTRQQLRAVRAVLPDVIIPIHDGYR